MMLFLFFDKIMCHKQEHHRKCSSQHLYVEHIWDRNRLKNGLHVELSTLDPCEPILLRFMGMNMDQNGQCTWGTKWGDFHGTRVQPHIRHQISSWAPYTDVDFVSLPFPESHHCWIRMYKYKYSFQSCQK